MCINDDRLRTDHPSEARTLTSDFMLLNIQFYEWYFVYQFVVVDILSFFFLVTVLSALLFGHCIVCPSFWSLYCLPFFLVIVLSALLFGHCIVCPSFWSLYCLPFFLVTVLSALLRYTASDYMYTFGIVKHFSIITDQ
jgi:hypothetical protein